MNKLQLKKVIKPLIKECLNEILVEQGLISIVKENITSQTKQVISKHPESKPIIKKLQQESINNKKQSANQLKESLSLGGFNPFAGTKDIDQVEAEGEKGVNVNSLFDEETINSWNQQLDILGRKNAG